MDMDMDHKLELSASVLAGGGSRHTPIFSPWLEATSYPERTQGQYFLIHSGKMALCALGMAPKIKSVC